MISLIAHVLTISWLEGLCDLGICALDVDQNWLKRDSMLEGLRCLMGVV